MTECSECKARCYPESPSQPFYMRGRYLPAICSTCPGRFNEPQTQVVEHIHRSSTMSSQEFRELERINGTLKYLLSKEKNVPIKGKKTYERYE